MSNVAINIAAEFTGKKAFKQADTATQKLTKDVKKLAGAFGIAFGVRAITNYGKNAVKAFAEDQKAAKALTLTLENLGMAFANPEVTKFISNLETQFGILDDQLRPAYQKLLTATGDYTKAQDLLRTSLDLSAMSGLDVQAVTTDLARAYAGNTRGLTKYALGLDKAQLAAMSFEEILVQISKVSAGQAESAADSYAGSIDRLNVAMANASETIGKSLITAIGTLSGGDGLPKTIELIETLSGAFARGIVLASRFIRNISILGSGNPFESIRDLREATRADQLVDRKENAIYGGVYAEIYQTQAKSYATGKKNLAQSKALTKETAAQLKNKKLEAAIDKAKLALGKSEEVFDMDKIQIAAALTSQAEALGKATTSSQILQIANDTARLNVKRSILDLEDAIAAKDEAAIIAATNKLNTDLKVLGTLGAQNLKLLDIKSILESLKPKDLINLDNLEAALALLGQISLANGAMGGTFGGGKVASPIVTTASVAAAIGARSGYDISGATDPRVAYGGQRIDSAGNYNSFNAEMAYAMGAGRYQGSSTGNTIVVNTGVGDPNAIAEAIDQVLTDAVQRGTLRGTFATS